MDEDLENVNPGKIPGFCETPTVRNIWRVVDYCRNFRDIGVVVGEPGVGKTTALTKYDALNGGYICTPSPAMSASLSAALRMIGETLGVYLPMRVSEVHRLICNRLSGYRESKDILIVDEAQNLNDQVIDELRCIHDETRLPMVFSGNASLRSRFNNTRVASFAQFTSRVGMRLDVERPARADVLALAKQANATDGKAVAYLERFALTAGGLRLVAKLLGIAGGLAGPDAPVTLDNLKAAARLLGVDK